MTKIDTSTEAVEALLKGVTPGPWVADVLMSDDPNGDEWATDVEVSNSSGRHIYGHDLGYRDDVDAEIEANARFIVAARDLVPALLAERDALQAEVDRCHARLEITHVWSVDMETEKETRIEIAMEDRPTAIDGITARDATIELLEEEIDRLRAQPVAVLEVANRYLTEQYGIRALGNVIDQERILSAITTGETE